MASATILSDNGVSSGSAGIKSTGGNDGVLLLQTTTSGGAATTAVTIDNAQNVGVGVTPSAWYTGSSWKVIDLPSAALRGGIQGVGVYANAYVNSSLASIYKNSSAYALAYQQQADTGAHAWFNAPSGTAGNTITFTQAMTLDVSGNLLNGTTSNIASGYRYCVSNDSGTTKFGFGPYSGTNNRFYVNDSSNAGVYLQAGNTSWTANSDERLKDIIEPITDAANKVSTLRAVIGKYKTDEEGVRRSFLIAQDIQSVLPEAVTASKLVGTDDETEYLGVQYTEVIPLLVAAIKEQQALITNLTERLVALEGK